MYCKDCGNKIKSWQEYCGRCGADLYRKGPKTASNEHPEYARFFRPIQ